jgi:ferredoxin-type protein NapH
VRAVYKIGLFLLVVSFIAMVFSFSLSRFMLTDAVLKNDLGGIKSQSGLSAYELVKPFSGEMIGKEYSSRTEFIADYYKLFEKGNNAQADDKNKIWEVNLFYVVKHSSVGLIAHPLYGKVLFGISFLLFCFSALVMIYARYYAATDGIKHNNIFKKSITAGGWIGILIGSFLIGFYIVLYFYPEYITNWVIMVDPVSYLLSGKEASQWFLYGFIYTLAMLTMGVRMYLKYRGNRYQQIRTFSVLGFQTIMAFLLPSLIQELHGHDLKDIWPLKYDYFADYNVDYHLGEQATFSATLVYLWGILLLLIGIPLFTYFFGKRWYCSWVCGCGGLAETAGDPFRQLSSKKLIAWKIERILIHSILVVACVMTLLLILAMNQMFDEKVAKSIFGWYGFLIGSVFSGVIGTGFYPILGNRIWCRFGCPLAAYIGIFQKYFSKFRITVNGGQCISCGNCSAYCEMGIDVRAYAQKGQNIVRASCVGCGVCSSVCPRGVLKLENGPVKNRVDDNPIIIGHEGVKIRN